MLGIFWTIIIKVGRGLGQGTNDLKSLVPAPEFGPLVPTPYAKSSKKVFFSFSISVFKLIFQLCRVFRLFHVKLFFLTHDDTRAPTAAASEVDRPVDHRPHHLMRRISMVSNPRIESSSSISNLVKELD